MSEVYVLMLCYATKEESVDKSIGVYKTELSAYSDALYYTEKAGHLAGLEDALETMLYHEPKPLITEADVPMMRERLGINDMREVLDLPPDAIAHTVHYTVMPSTIKE